MRREPTVTSILKRKTCALRRCELRGGSRRAPRRAVGTGRAERLPFPASRREGYLPPGHATPRADLSKVLPHFAKALRICSTWAAMSQLYPCGPRMSPCTLWNGFIPPRQAPSQGEVAVKKRVPHQCPAPPTHPQGPGRARSSVSRTEWH